MLLVDVAPASAELPAISCTQRSRLNWCVSYLNFRAQAGVGNPTGLTQSLSSRLEFFRVELVFYPGTPAQRGDVIFASDTFYNYLLPSDVRRSPDFATFLPGTYCARLYVPSQGYYVDQHCVTTSGQVVPGNFGMVPPRGP